MEKFQISLKNLNNLWSFIEIYAVFVLYLYGEKSVWRKSLWRKNDKYEVWSREIIHRLKKSYAGGGKYVSMEKEIGGGLNA